MGTRHLICVVKDREYKVAQYGQWDGYPSGQGVDILNFIKSVYNEKRFLNGLQKIKFGTPEELNQQWINCGAEANAEWVGVAVSDAHDSRYPENSRDTGSEILNIIQNTKEKLLLKNSLEFAKDSLFCEWCYVIDLDKNQLEVYEGFNKNILSSDERFYFDGWAPTDNEYYPVKHKFTFSFDKLPDENDFLSILERNEE